MLWPLVLAALFLLEQERERRSVGDAKPRIGIKSKGGKFGGSDWKIRRQDIGIDADETDIDVDKLDIE